MSGQLRALKKRIRTVESTRKITRAMEMVAAAKLRRVQNMMLQAKPYTEALSGLVQRLAANKRGISHPFFEKKQNSKTALVVMTSDTGLCGSFNASLIETARRFIAARTTPPALIGIGKTGITAFEKSGFPFRLKFIKTRMTDIEKMLSSLAENIQQIHLGGDVGEVYVIHSRYLPATGFNDATEKLLPMEQAAEVTPGNEGEAANYIFEPSPEKIFAKIIPAHFRAKIRMMVLEAMLAEHTARMNSMHLATKNADEMSERLVLLRNKIRQAAITKELIEIVSGSRALEGK